MPTNTRQNARLRGTREQETRVPSRVLKPEEIEIVRESSVSSGPALAGKEAGELALIGPHPKDANRNARGHSPGGAATVLAGGIRERLPAFWWRGERPSCP